MDDLATWKENLVFITGGSKGIGKALVKKYLENNFEVVSFARSEINQLEVDEFQNGASLNQIKVDLSDLDEVQTTLEYVLQHQSMQFDKRKRIVWINNAGTTGQMDNLENISIDNIGHTVRLNFTAPLILTNLFLKYTKTINAEKKIINISSGAAKTAYQGWSVYGSTKAALDSLSATLALEQSTLANGAKILGIHPGVVETNMQDLIREQDETNFKSVKRFKELKENGALYQPNDVANAIYNLDLDDLPSGEIVRVNL